MRKILFTWLVLLFVLGNQCAFGQFNETIRTGRPGQAIGPFGVGTGVFQVQTGYQFENIQRSASIEHIHGQATTLRIGLTNVFEINTGFAIQQNRILNHNQLLTNHYEGVSNWGVGFRYHVFGGKGLIPSIGLQTSINLNNTLQKEYQTNNATPKLMLITKQDLFKSLSLFTNIGINWSGTKGEPKASYVLNLSYSLSPKVGLVLENYGNAEQSYWDGGISYLLNPNIQFDLYGGGRNKQWFLSLGCSWRFFKQ